MTACAPCMAVGADVGAGTPALSDAFFDALARMGLRRGTNPEHYLVVWCAESGLDPTAVNPRGGARGLNQMMPATLRGLGAPADYEKLPGEAQLPWIERLIADGERLNGGPFQSAARYYHSNFYPATMSRGNSPSTVVVSRDARDPQEQAAYAANSGLDTDKDGQITLADLGALLARLRATRCQDGFARLARAVAALGVPPVEPTPAAPGPELVARRSAAGPFLAIGFVVGTVRLLISRTR